MEVAAYYLWYNCRDRSYRYLLAHLGFLIWYVRGKLKGDNAETAEPSRAKYEMTESTLK